MQPLRSIAVDAPSIPRWLRTLSPNAWTEACELAEKTGVRNAQTTVLAPTGTISFMMDCDTTGNRARLCARKHKQLVGGGSLAMVNRTVPPGVASARICAVAHR